MAKVTKCNECPVYPKLGNESVPVYRNGQRMGYATNREVPFRGPTANVEVVALGESPGPVELQQGFCFAGDTGDAAFGGFRDNGVDPEGIFWMNATRCHLSKELKSSKKTVKSAMDCCRPAVIQALKHLKPRLVVLFGAIAMEQVMKAGGITQKRGQFFWSKEFECWVFPTFHPAACMRDQAKWALWHPDMRSVCRFIKDGFRHAQAGQDKDYQDVESIRFLLDKRDYTAALDTETQGKDWTNPNSVVISYSVSDEDGKGYNVFLGEECEPEEADAFITWPRMGMVPNAKGKMVKGLVDTQVPIKYAPEYERRMAELTELCEREDIKLVMMNGNYDLHRLRQLGIQRDQVKKYVMSIDLAIHATNPDVFKQADLLTIQKVLIPDQPDHKSQFGAQVDKSDMLAAAKENRERHVVYACADTDSTLRCAKALRDILKEDMVLARYYTRLAHPVESELLLAIEKNGIEFDVAGLPAVKDEVAAIMRQKEEEFFQLVPPCIVDMHRDKGLRLTRNQILKDALFHKRGFGLRPLEKTPTGDATTNRKVLVRMRDELPDDHPAKELMSVYIEWGPYQKLYSTYLTGFEEAVKCDGRLHTQISKTFTATGRTGSRSPNLQNIPKRNKRIAALIRRLMRASNGKVLVAIDWSQSELRWIADDSQDPEFLRVYRCGEDIHRNTAKMLVQRRGLDWDGMDKPAIDSWRRNAKAGNFGLVYGMQPKGFQSYARDEYGVKLSLEESTEFRDAFLYEKYRGLPGWHDRKIAFARQHGYTRSKFGFKRMLPNINATEFDKKSEAERLAINTDIQSASNDSMLFAGLLLQRRNIVDDCRARVVLFIHDELVFEVDENHVDEFIASAIDCMVNLPLKETFGFELTVPLVADASTGVDLAHMTEYKH